MRLRYFNVRKNESKLNDLNDLYINFCGACKTHYSNLDSIKRHVKIRHGGVFTKGSQIPTLEK